MKKNFKNKKIIITGGTGYIGSKLVTTLLNFESKIFLLVRSDKVVKTRFSKNKNLKIIKGDILNNNFWKKNITNKDYLFHLAGSGGLFKSGIPVGIYHKETEEDYELVHFFSKLSQLTFVKLVSFEESSN